MFDFPIVANTDQQIVFQLDPTEENLETSQEEEPCGPWDLACGVNAVWDWATGGNESEDSENYDTEVEEIKIELFGCSLDSYNSNLQTSRTKLGCYATQEEAQFSTSIPATASDANEYCSKACREQKLMFFYIQSNANCNCLKFPLSGKVSSTFIAIW